MTEEEYTAEEIACVVHEALRGLQLVNREPHVTDFWDIASPRMQARMVASVKYAIDHPEATAEDMHNRWLEHMENHSWRWGEKWDRYEQTHPNLRPWQEISVKDQRKTDLLLVIVRDWALRAH